MQSIIESSVESPASAIDLENAFASALREELRGDHTPASLAAAREKTTAARRAITLRSLESAHVESVESPSLSVTPNDGQFNRLLAAARKWLADKDHSSPPSLRRLFLDNGGDLAEGEKLSLSDSQKTDWKPLRKAIDRAHSTYVSAHKRKFQAAIAKIERDGGLLRARLAHDKKGAIRSVSLAAKVAPKPRKAKA